MLSENIDTILFLVAIPIVQQLIKLYRDKKGKTIGKLGNQVIALVLAAGALALSGELFGIAAPVLPVMVPDDVLASVENSLEFLGEGVAFLGVLWAIIAGLYEVVYDRLFKLVSEKTPLTLVTADKLAVG